MSESFERLKAQKDRIVAREADDRKLAEYWRALPDCPDCNGRGGWGDGGFDPINGEWQAEMCERCSGRGKDVYPAPRAASPETAPRGEPEDAKNRVIASMLESGELARVIADKIAERYPYDPDVLAYEEAKKAEWEAFGAFACVPPATGERGTRVWPNGYVFPLTVKEAADAIRNVTKGRTYSSNDDEEFYRDAAFAVMKAWAAVRAEGER